VEQAESIPVRTLFSRTMQILDHLSKEASPQERAALRRAMTTLRTSLSMAERAEAELPALDVASQLHLAAGIIEPTSSDRAALKVWGADLKARRRAAGLSRAVLADRAGISDSTLRNVETGRRAPTRTTVMHLQSVPELRIDPSPIGSQITSRRQRSQDLSPNCWLTPEYDALKLHGELTMLLNGRGGHLEQTYLYLDPSSAAAWYAIAEQEVYTLARMLMPMDRVAEQISERAGAVGLDVIGLGCGDGKDEVRLTQCLLERHSNQNLRLYLLDISQPLCCAAYRHAAEVLADRPTVSVCAIQGNFHNLQRYTPLLHSQERSHRRRVVCIFGNTFANLQNEIMFVRNSLLGFAPGDCLLLNVPATMAPADNQDEVRRKDPRLAGRSPTETMTPALSIQNRMYTELLRRYISGIKSTEIKSTLDYAACPVPGSYAADVRATVKMQSGETKHFSIAYIKRYDRALLDEAMRKEGWAPASHWRYAEEYHPRLLLLYQRVRAVTDET
jgi:transcriptional regulator with XRE-family HTH domain